MLRLKRNILATLAYFDMFDYPLTYNEILLFLACKCAPGELETAIHFLTTHQFIFKFGEFYSLKNDYGIIIRRNKGNNMAAAMIKKAQKVGEWLIKFPYVRGVGISGSLSKNFADENSDIDLFIITAPNRIWIARTIMHCFKKLTFLVNKQHYYCMNYYVDEAQMEIVEKNIYTAIEVATIIPLQGSTSFSGFYSANAWAKKYLPNKVDNPGAAAAFKKPFFKSMLETLFNNVPGNGLESILMKITAKRWNKKTRMRKLNARGTVMSMQAGRHFAKPDPEKFQVRLIERYEQKILSLLAQSSLETIK